MAPQQDAAWNIYAKQLIGLHYGYPLWDPEPEATIPEVELGAVGYFDQGKFRQLFNVMKSNDDQPHQRLGVPPDFQQFADKNLNITPLENAITQNVLTSRSITSRQVGAEAEADT